MTLNGSHNVNITPLQEYRDGHNVIVSYDVTCSAKDLSRTADDIAEAKEIAWGHVSEVCMRVRDEKALDTMTTRVYNSTV